jgi:hypothetical protein
VFVDCLKGISAYVDQTFLPHYISHHINKISLSPQKRLLIKLFDKNLFNLPQEKSRTLFKKSVEISANFVYLSFVYLMLMGTSTVEIVAFPFI